MLTALDRYKATFHFSVNFFSIFLLVTFIPDILHIDNELIKYSFWGVKVLLAIWVISKSRGILTSFSPLEHFYLIVAVIYLANIYVDIFINPLPFMKGMRGLIDFVGFFLGVIIALSFRYTPALQSDRSFRFFWISITTGLVIAYFLAVQSSDLEALGSRYDANSTINTIMYGQTGCALSLISVYGLVVYPKKFLRLLFIITFLIGILSIAKAGSRSPIIILLIVSMFFFMARMGKFKGILVILILGGLVITFIHPILELLESMGSSLGTRMNNAIEEGDTSGRDHIYQNVFGLISESPILGAYYFIPSGAGFNSYPHNFFLEVFMATGFLGGIPFVILVLITLFRAFNLLRMKHPSGWILIIYLQIISYGMFSTSLFGSQEFWTLLFFVTSLTWQNHAGQPAFINSTNPIRK